VHGVRERFEVVGVEPLELTKVSDEEEDEEEAKEPTRMPDY